VVTTRLCTRACSQLVYDLPLTWSSFSTTLGRNWIRTDAMDIMIRNLWPFLPESVMVLTSMFGDHIRRGDIRRLHRLRCFREARKAARKYCVSVGPTVSVSIGPHFGSTSNRAAQFRSSIRGRRSTQWTASMLVRKCWATSATAI
jgi:hypothetical protein